MTTINRTTIGLMLALISGLGHSYSYPHQNPRPGTEKSSTGNSPNDLLRSDRYGSGGDKFSAAVYRKHSIDSYPVAIGGRHQQNEVPVININSPPLVLKIRFNSHSSRIETVQNHFGSQGRVKKSDSIDQPDVLFHSVRKPVIQEIKEVISPYRKRVQEVKPVQEKVVTIFATGKTRSSNHHGDRDIAYHPESDEGRHYYNGDGGRTPSATVAAPPSSRSKYRKSGSSPMISSWF